MNRSARTFYAWTSLAAAAALLALSGTGCPPQPGANQNPVANAGTDQTVAPGALVTLTGTATDADGDTLTYAWTQTAGGAVTLNNANTSNATFTAPAAAATLTFELTVSDGRGGTGTDSVTVTVSTTAPPAVNKALLVTNLNGNSVTAYTLATPNDINGNIAPTANLSGANTLIAAPRGLEFDSNKDVQVGNDGNNSITSYGAATTLANINGNIAPARNVQGAASAVNILRGIARQTTTDLMYVSDAGVTPAIRVFTGASTAGFNGNLAPVRTITTAGTLTAPRGICLDANDELYVANETPARVFVYATASTLNGNIAPTRIIQNAAIGAARDVFVDTSGRLFVVDNANQKVHVYNNGGTVNGNVAPDVTLTVTGANVLNSVVTDKAGTGYITDRVGNKVYSYDNLATRNGAITPDRTLTGGNTLLNQPYNVRVLE